MVQTNFFLEPVCYKSPLIVKSKQCLIAVLTIDEVTFPLQVINEISESCCSRTLFRSLELGIKLTKLIFTLFCYYSKLHSERGIVTFKKVTRNVLKHFRVNLILNSQFLAFKGSNDSCTTL